MTAMGLGLEMRVRPEAVSCLWLIAVVSVGVLLRKLSGAFQIPERQFMIKESKVITGAISILEEVQQTRERCRSSTTPSRMSNRVKARRANWLHASLPVR